MTDIISASIALPALKLRIAATTPSQALSAIDTVCVALNRQESSAERLRVLLGHLMAEVQDKKLFEPEHSSFEAFTKFIAEKHHLARTTVRDSLMIARRLPRLEPEQAEKMPLTNLTLVARAAKDAEPRVVSAILKEAEKFSVADFRQKMEDRGLIGKRGRPTEPSKHVTLRIIVSQAVAARWRAFVDDRDPGQALASLMPGMMKRSAAAA